ncbi:MAG: hypothetical protein EB084_15310 [Proteobacteria bacterium]|nr:hypothetical protein [Pseudomonadota bacterium]
MNVLRCTLTTLSLALLVGGVAVAAPPPDIPRAFGPDAVVTPLNRRGDDPLAKMNKELQIVYFQFTRPGRADYAYSDAELTSIFGIAKGDRNPWVEVSLEVADGFDVARVEKAGAKVRERLGNHVFAVVPVAALERVAGERTVTSVQSLFVGQRPRPRASQAVPLSEQVTPSTRGGAFDNSFDKRGLTGKGVAIAIIDSGIDWHHPDFLRPDGTTRILAMYDVYDTSFDVSGGKVGSRPPINAPNGKPQGTVYTRAQINAALAGTGVVDARKDVVGHGTACASTAAGNGRATANGVPAGQYAGVAPDADLIIVNADTLDDGGIVPFTYKTLDWIKEVARAAREPVVLSMSYGGHFNTHEGVTPEEVALNAAVGEGKPGIVACVSAGNEGEETMHAAGRFSAPLPGEQFHMSPSIELFVTDKRGAVLCGCFSALDEWGLQVTALEGPMAAAKGGAFSWAVWKKAGQLMLGKTKDLPSDTALPARLDAQASANRFVASPRTEAFSIMLPKGRYILFGFGASATVPNGGFDLYLPGGGASFGKGTVQQCMVGAPAMATNVIAVGAYQFRPSWASAEGRQVYIGMDVGRIASYSSPGFRRDGWVKPDIAAPATYTISALSKDAPGFSGRSDRLFITADGQHVAWEGTSAACPFTAGVIALMLQKNPTLDAALVRSIIMRTARRDTQTGAVPNPQWGWGKLDPTAAINAVPSPKAVPTKKPGTPSRVR